MYLQKELANEDITKSLFNRVEFFSIAEGGAMGEPGGIVAITSDKIIYHCNYVYGDSDVSLIL